MVGNKGDNGEGTQRIICENKWRTWGSIGENKGGACETNLENGRQGETWAEQKRNTGDMWITLENK